MKRRQIAIWMAISLMMSTFSSSIAAAEMILPEEPANAAVEEDDLLLEDGEEIADSGNMIADEFEEDTIEPEEELSGETLIIDDDEEEEPDIPEEPAAPETPADDDTEEEEAEPEPSGPRKAPADDGLIVNAAGDYEMGKGWPIDAANWPDAAFRGYIADNIDTDGDGYISDLELGEITQISCGQLGIQSLEGVDLFYNLKQLYANNNLISEFSESLAQLEELSLSYNANLQSVDVTWCEQLKYLDLWGTDIASIDLSQNPELVTFSIYGATRLTELDLSQNTKLVSLTVRYCDLTSLDTYNLPHLRSVEVDGNQNLRMADFRDNPELEKLWIGVTGIDWLWMCRPLPFKDPEFMVTYPTTLRCILYTGMPSDKYNDMEPIEYEVAFSEADRQVMKNIYDAIGTKIIMYYHYGASAWDDAAIASVPQEYVELVPWNSLSNEVQSFELDTKDIQLEEGSDYPVRAFASPETPAPQYVWTSADPSVASVGQDGTIHAVSTGVTYIKVTGQPGEIFARSSEIKVTVVDRTTGTETEAEDPDVGFSVNETAFPDPIFRQYVLDNLDTNKDEHISPIEVYFATEIDCEGLAIRTFKGIEKFENLEELNISSTDITAFPYLGSLTKLKILYCRYVSLPKLDFRYNSELVSLYCDGDPDAGRQIGGLDISSCPKLKTLFCRENGLTDIDIWNNTRLIQVDIGGNDLYALDLRRCPELEHVNVSDNMKFETLLFDEDANSLTQLMINGTAITSLDTANMPSLRVLAAADNPYLSSLDLSSNKRMSELWFNGTAIETIELTTPTHFRPDADNISAYPATLKEVYYNGHSDEYMPCEPIFMEADQLYLNEHYEETGEYLRVYYPYDNRAWISDKLDGFRYVYWIPWDPDTGKIMADGYAINIDNWPDAAFRKYIAENIDTDQNGFIANDEILATTVLNCDELGIKSMKGVDIFYELEEIHLETNELTELDVTGLKKLQRLYAGYNNLTSINVTECPELYGLALWNNLLTEVDISKNPQLDWINVSNNTKLTKLEVYENRSMRFIYARECDLEELDTTNLRLLEEVDVNENTRLRVVDFKCNPYLTYLGASHTAITSMDMCRPVPFKEEYHLIEAPDNLESIFYWGVGSDYEVASNDPIDYKVAFTEDDRYAMECIHRIIGKKLVMYYPYQVAAWDAEALATISTDDVELIPWDAMTGKVQKFAFEEKEVELVPGYSKKLADPIATPATPRPSYVWSSSNPKVATVSQDGTVRALASGTTTIKVTGLAYEPLKREATITVRVVKGGRITYVLNGGKNNPKNVAGYTAEEGMTLYSPTKTGYTFAGWYTDSAFTKKVTGIIPGATGNKTFYAKWTPITYKIRFYWNTGTSGKMPILSCTYDKAVKLPANTIVKKYYTFTGWNTKADGTGTAYKNQQWVKNLSTKNGATVALYAQWKRATYKIVYNKNSSAATGTVSNQTANQGVTVKLWQNHFSRKGYTFAGWAKTATGPVVYKNGASVWYSSLNPTGKLL